MASGTACSCKDESVRRCCKAGSLFCAAAMALKSITGGESSLAETALIAARDRASATGF